jgi:hypothetical protein
VFFQMAHGVRFGIGLFIYVCDVLMESSGWGIMCCWGFDMANCLI